MCFTKYATHGSSPSIFPSLPRIRSIKAAVEHRGMYINGEYRRVTHFEMTYRHLRCAHVACPSWEGWLSHQPVIYSDLMRPDMFNKHERGAKGTVLFGCDVCLDCRWKYRRAKKETILLRRLDLLRKKIKARRTLRNNANGACSK